MIRHAIHLPPELAAACAEDIRRFEDETAGYRNGSLLLAEYKGRRARHGTYEQRQDGLFMVRPRVPAGVLTPAALRAVAAAAREFGDGVPHLTTRQDMQVHGVPEGDVPEVMRRLLAADLPCRGAGGDAPRNTAACPLAGVCPHEAFDVTPHALALGGQMLAAAAEFSLPRKFKPAFSGCDCDCAGAKIADGGFIARIRDGKPGFVLYAGGGLGANSRPADLLEEWIPEADAPAATRALLKMFARHGDRANRARARLRFVFERLGIDAARAEFRRELAAELAAAADIPKSKIQNSPVPAPALPPWRVTLAHPASGLRIIRQRQNGLATVAIRPPLGLMAAAGLERVAEAAARFSQEKTLRLTPDQGLLLRSVPEAQLPALGVFLGRIAAEPEAVDPAVLMTVCSGAATCRLGQFDSREFARALAEILRRAALPPELLEAADIRVSGCLNACAQAPVAGIGLCGLGRPGDNGKIAPHYRILLGASRGDGPAILGEAVTILPAGRVPGAILALLREWRTASLPGETMAAFFKRLGPERLRLLLETPPAPASPAT